MREEDMKAEDERYDPCCGCCRWADEIYTGTFCWRLYCFFNPQRVKPTLKNHVCEKWQEEE